MYTEGHLMYAEFEADKADMQLVHIHTDASCASKYGAKSEQMIHLKAEGEIIIYDGEIDGDKI